MKQDSISIVDDSMQKALEELWEKYKNEFSAEMSDQAKNLGEILDRGRVWAENDSEKTEILVTEINPSARQKDSEFENKSFRYHEVQHDPYYAEIKKKLLGDDLNGKAGYLDLFAVRETVQKRMSRFIKHPIGLSFVAEHLAITQKEIERLRPRLIIVKNKGSWMFWGLDAGQTAGKWTNVWMGYTFDQISGYEDVAGRPWKVRRITGLLDTPDRVGKEIRETCLVGTIVLFTSHLQYLKKEDRPTIEMVMQLYDSVSSN